jgi:hypothetical protein
MQKLRTQAHHLLHVHLYVPAPAPPPRALPRPPHLSHHHHLHGRVLQQQLAHEEGSITGQFA